MRFLLPAGRQRGEASPITALRGRRENGTKGTCAEQKAGRGGRFLGSAAVEGSKRRSRGRLAVGGVEAARQEPPQARCANFPET